MKKPVITLLALSAAALVAVPTAAPAKRAHDLSAQDVNYLQTSISGDRFEIAGGKLALSKAASDSVRALGRRLIADHSKSLQEALAEAKEDGVKAPKAPTPSMVWQLQTIGATSGSTFDRMYTSLEVKDHQQDIEETTFEVQHGSDAKLRASAKKELSTLRMHLVLSQKASHSS